MHIVGNFLMDYVSVCIMACAALLALDDLMRFRTKPCRRVYNGVACDFEQRCQYSHNKFWNRRCPYYITDKTALRYVPIICPDVRLDANDNVLEMNCKRGGACFFAHTKEEIHFHPLYYKSELCPDFHGQNQSCKRFYCYLIHGLAEKRKPLNFVMPFTPNDDGSCPIPILPEIEYRERKGVFPLTSDSESVSSISTLLPTVEATVSSPPEKTSTKFGFIPSIGLIGNDNALNNKVTTSSSKNICDDEVKHQPPPFSTPPSARVVSTLDESTFPQHPPASTSTHYVVDFNSEDLSSAESLYTSIPNYNNSKHIHVSFANEGDDKAFHALFNENLTNSKTSTNLHHHAAGRDTSRPPIPTIADEFAAFGHPLLEIAVADFNPELHVNPSSRANYISVRAGDKVQVLHVSPSGWTKINKAGCCGWVPAWALPSDPNVTPLLLHPSHPHNVFDETLARQFATAFADDRISFGVEVACERSVKAFAVGINADEMGTRGRSRLISELHALLSRLCSIGNDNSGSSSLQTFNKSKASITHYSQNNQNENNGRVLDDLGMFHNQSYNHHQSARHQFMNGHQILVDMNGSIHPYDGHQIFTNDQ